MKRILILAHREELIYQAVQHARNAGLTSGIEMGAQWSRREEVVVSTVQTLNAESRCRLCAGLGLLSCNSCGGTGRAKRMQKFDPFEFGLVVTDEGHHGTAKSYRAVYQHFTRNPQLKLLFVTATPLRSDGIGLHNVCESVAYEMDLRSAIDAGWLCPIRQRFITVENLDLSRVGTKFGGDLKDGELERAFLGDGDDEEQLLHAIAKPTIDEAHGQPGIVFAAGCEHARKLTAAFNAYSGVRAELILGSTDKETRRSIVRRFKQGETQFLINVGVATEGFDAPAAAVVAVARPTKSASLYLQMIGRGTRPLPGVVDGPLTAELRRAAIAASGKRYCTVLDFVGNSGEHKLVSVADVLAGDEIPAVDLASAVQRAREEGQAVDVDAILENARQQKQAREERQREEEEEQRRQAESTRHYAERAEYTATDVDLFGGGRRFDPFHDYTPTPDGATPKQVHLLLALGVTPQVATGYTKRQAGKVIDELQRKQTGGEFRMPFGKHRGKRLRELPRGYVAWMKQNLTGNAKLMQHVALMEGRTNQTAGAF